MRFVATERIRLLFAQAGPGLAVNVLVGVALVVLLWPHARTEAAIFWLVTLLLTVLGRALLARAYLHAQPTPRAHARWRGAQVAGTFIAGAVWGGAPWTFGATTSFEQHVFLMLVLGGMACGAIPVLASELRAYLAFVGPLCGGVLAWLMLQQVPPYPSLAGFTAFFFLTMMATARNYEQSLTRALLFAEANRRLSTTLLRTRDREALLRDDRERLRDFADLGADVYWETDADLCVSFVSPRCTELLGINADRLIHRPARKTARWLGEAGLEAVAAMLRREPFESVHLRVTRADEQVIHLLASGKPVYRADHEFCGYRGMLRDVTVQQALTERLAHQAAHDQLTGLINRREFEQRLARAVASVDPGRGHVLLYMDLDRFKSINDTCGHPAGDAVLREIAALIRGKLRGRDSFGRLGGDEFAVLMEQCPLEAALVVAEAVRAVVASYHFEQGQRLFSLGISIGVVVVQRPDEDAATLIECADAACYAAKTGGRDRIEIASGAVSGVVVAASQASLRA